MHILVLGGNGFIGQSVCQKLLTDGHAVTALGRSVNQVRQRLPQVAWISQDIGRLTTPDDWQTLISGKDAIVNCAGALQDGSRDDVQAVQQTAMLSLYAAAEKQELGMLVQISAVTEGTGRDLPFLATKRMADAALKQSTVPYVILRPALVIGRNAYGGSALLRALAAFPIVTPLIFGEKPVQITALSDLCEAISASIDGRIASQSDILLATPDTLPLRSVIAMHRSWLGLRAAPIFELPGLIAAATSWLADCAGWLGWRSPLRSTAMTIMSGGVTSGQTPSAISTPFPLLSLDDTLAAHPSGVQDLWFARLYWLKPLIVVILAIFWIASGVITLFCFDASAAHLAPHFGSLTATILTLMTSLPDVALGLLVVFRRHSAKAMIAMLLLSFIYLVAGTILDPGLWLDPLGPYVKVFPSLCLTLVGLAVLGER
jgi:uncharacterized protein YbjT (DUF2867 family)